MILLNFMKGMVNNMEAQNKEHCLNFSGGNVPIADVARIMKKSPMYIRIGLQRGLLPIGIAIKKDDNRKNYDYYVSPKLLYEYTGFLYNEKKQF